MPERAAAFISCASSIPPEPKVPFFTLAHRIFRSWCYAMPTRGLDLSRRWPLAIRRRIGRIRLARNFLALLLEWNLCLQATLPGPHNDPAKPSGTWCSRTWWHGIDFVAVPRDWLAGVKRAEVETAGALPGSGFFDRAMPIVEVSFRLRRQVTSAQGVLTHLAWLCGDLRFASRSSFSRLPLLLFLRSFRWMSTPGYWQRLPRCLGDVRLLGYKLRHRRIGWTRRLGERSALMLWQEEHTKRPAGYSPEPGSRRFSRSGGMQ